MIYVYTYIYIHEFFKGFLCGILTSRFGWETLFCGILIYPLRQKYSIIWIIRVNYLRRYFSLADFWSQPRNHEIFIPRKILALKHNHFNNDSERISSLAHLFAIRGRQKRFFKVVLGTRLFLRRIWQLWPS